VLIKNFHAEWGDIDNILLDKLASYLANKIQNISHIQEKLSSIKEGKASLNIQMERLNREIEELQKQCPHPTDCHITKMSDEYLVCSICGKVLSD
jgi:hypothetical protein